MYIKQDAFLRKKITVAFVLDQIEYQMGGTEKQILMILDNIDQSRFDIHLCLFRHSQWMVDNADKYKIFYFDFPSFKAPKSYFEFARFVRYLKKQQFDIVVSFFIDSNKIAVPAAKLAGIRNIVLSRRNFNHWVTKTELFILKRLKPYVSSYWVNAGAIRELLVKQEGVDSGKIEVIYNGFDLTVPERANTPDALKGIAQSKIVINVSNLRKVKSLDVFLRAAGLVVSEYNDVHFVVVGEGDERPVLEQMIEDLGLGRHVSLLGKQNGIGAFLKFSDIGVLSSHSEGLSNAIIEYMASGLPVVCTDVGGSSEMVSDNENGYLVPAGDYRLMGRKILELLENDGLREKMGAESNRKAHEMFQCDIMIENVSRYLSEMAG